MNEFKEYINLELNGFGKITEIIKNKITLVVLLVVLVFIAFCQVRMNKKKLVRIQKRYEYNKERFQKAMPSIKIE